MMQKILTVVLVFGLSVTGVQAGVINFTGTYDAPNELDFFKFTNNTAGDVQIVMDTFSDGFDADMIIWKKAAGTVIGQPDDSEWQIVKWSPEGTRPESLPGGVEVGSNIFGVVYKNGYLPNDLLNQGTSDPGELLVGLAAGDYLISVTGGFNGPNGGGFAGELMSAGLQGFEDFSPLNVYPQTYGIDITGDVSVSAVPVPAAVWLFGTAIAGLGAVRRKTAAVAVA